MQSEFFQKQIERLRGIYSAGALNQERVDIWWKKFRTEPNHVFENAINHVIAEATTNALPAMSRVTEALGFFRSNPDGASNMKEFRSAFACEPCRDFGFGFNGDTVTSCSCDRARRISPDALAKAQKEYNAGAAFMRKGSAAVIPGLPYDPGERIGAE